MKNEIGFALVSSSRCGLKALTGLILLFQLSSFIFAATPAGQKKEAARPAASLKVEGGIVQFGEPVVVSSGTFVEGSVIVVGAGVQVFGPVGEDVAVLGGSALIDSAVEGSVVVVGKSVGLGPNALVGGDLVTIGARVSKAPSAVVKGDTISIPGFKPAFMGAIATVTGVAAAILFWLKIFASLGWAILALLVAVLFPGPLEDTSDFLTGHPFWSLGAGVLAVPVALVVACALLFSIVGVALLPLLGIALAAFGVWGYITIGFWVGDQFFRAMQMYVQAWLACLLGTTLIQLLRWIPVVGSWILGVALIFGVGSALAAFLTACFRWRKAVPVA